MQNQVSGTVAYNKITNNHTIDLLLQDLNWSKSYGIPTFLAIIRYNRHSNIENRRVTKYAVNLNNNTFTKEQSES